MPDLLQQDFMFRVYHRKQLTFCHQRDEFDCGPACLDMILRFHGREVSREVLRRLCCQDRNGTSIASIARAAEQLGFQTLAVKLRYEDLRDRAFFPCIAFWPQGHFVVVTGVRKQTVHVADPALCRTSYTRQEFEECWLTDDARHSCGIVLLIEATGKAISQESATQSRDSVDFWHPLWVGVRKSATPLAIGVLTMLVVQLILPFMSGALVDTGIARRSISIVTVILLAEAILIISRLSLDLFQQWLLAYIGGRIDIALIARFLAKLTRLPIAFFDSKILGDLVQRIEDQRKIRLFLTQGISQAGLALLFLAVFATALAVLNLILFVVFITGSSLYVAYCFFYFRRQRILSYKNFRLSARKQGQMLEFLSGIQEIKLNNAVQQRRWAWEKTQHLLSKLDVKIQLLSSFQQKGSAVITEATNLLLTLIVTRSVIAGQMSLGSMITLEFIIGQLTVPLGQLATLMFQSHEAKLSYARVREIHSVNDEEDRAMQPTATKCQDITLSRVKFHYGGTNRTWIFRDLSLHIPSGAITAIVGPTGGGKTTLLKLILKFYPADEGVITLGDRDIADISTTQFRAQCGVVMQDGYIFSDSILNNIAIGADCVDENRVVEVTRVAQIRDFIESLPLGFDTRIGRDGIGISRGQAQRILIARALYRNPMYLLLDEPTSALDAETENIVVEHLHSTMRGRTVVIIAHRLSTIRNADQIIVLQDGAAVETGTHSELLRSGGKYFDLVRSQLSPS